MGDVFICDAVRTPIGRFGGSLAKVRADDLAAAPIKTLMARHPKLDWSQVDEVYFGCANQAGEDNRNVARMALLLAGLPETVPGATLNRLCASGLDAVGAAGRDFGVLEEQFVEIAHPVEQQQPGMGGFYFKILFHHRRDARRLGRLRGIWRYGDGWLDRHRLRKLQNFGPRSYRFAAAMRVFHPLNTSRA